MGIGITGCTPLHSACKIGGVEIIKELVKAGAEVNQLNKYGATPMYYIWESEKYCLCDSKESEKASKFLREKGGVTKSRELIPIFVIGKTNGTRYKFA